MEKVTLSIIKIGNEYRAVIQIGENTHLANRKVVYQCSRFTSEKLQEIRKLSLQLKEKAKKWARKKGIKYVVNIDLNPYEEQRFLEKNLRTFF